MEFLTITSLKEVCGYRDRRSVTKWLTETLGLRMQRVGKNWCVVKEEYEEALVSVYGKQQGNNAQKKIRAANIYEQKFLDDLQDFLSHV